MKKIFVIPVTILLSLSMISCTNISNISLNKNQDTQSTEIEETDIVSSEDITPVLDFSEYHIGDTILFGEYEQDGNKTNGKEKIAWRILDIKDNQLFVISEYILDFKNYDTSWESEGSSWEDSELRTWLNADFFNTAFTVDEQAVIPTVTIQNVGSTYRDGAPNGNDTNDKLFCLSLDECKEYFGEPQLYSDEIMRGYNYKTIAKQTQYSLNHCDILGCGIGGRLSEGAFSATPYMDPLLYDKEMSLEDIYPEEVKGVISGPWWLRTMAVSNKAVCYISDDGLIGDGLSYNPGHLSGVRPVMYIDLSNESARLLEKGEPQKYELNIPEYVQYTSSFTPGVVLANWDIDMNPSDESLAWKLSQDLNSYITTYCPDIDQMYVAEIIPGTELETSITYSIQVKIKGFNDDGSDLIVKAIWAFGTPTGNYNFFSDLSPDGTDILVDKDGNPIDWDSPINNPFE